NLKSGERKVFVRGFKGAVVSNNGSSLGDFPRLENVSHSLVLLNPADGSANIYREIPDRGAQLYGRFVFVRESLRNLKAADDKKANPDDPPVPILPGKSSESSLDS